MSNPTNTSGFEWTESGLQLLERLKTIALKNGGYQRYAEGIEFEWKEQSPYQRAKFEHRQKIRDYSPDEIRFLVRNKDTMTYAEIAHRMKNRTESAIRRKISLLNKKQKNGSTR